MEVDREIESDLSDCSSLRLAGATGVHSINQPEHDGVLLGAKLVGCGALRALGLRKQCRMSVHATRGGTKAVGFAPAEV